jgi:hypothetical protein
MGCGRHDEVLDAVLVRNDMHAFAELRHLDFVIFPYDYADSIHIKFLCIHDPERKLEVIWIIFVDIYRSLISFLCYC